MVYFHVLPHLHRNGGIKVAIQHSHILNRKGINCFVTAPGGEIKAVKVNYGTDSPYPNYTAAKIISWEEAHNIINPEDVVIFNWGADIKEFGSKLNNKKYYFAQACFFTPDENHNNLDLYGQPDVLKDDIEIVTISEEVHRYFLYGFRKDSRVVNNWINTDIFRPDKSKRVENRVGMISHRAYSAGEVIEKVKKGGFQFLQIGGTENQVAEQMRTCEYFVSCSNGIHNGWRETEGFPLPSAEAMASGCFVVSFDNGGCREYLHDTVTGFIAEENTADGVLSDLMFAKGCDFKEEIRRNAIESIRRRFNETAIFEQIQRAFMK